MSAGSPTASDAEQQVFICYRREETAAYAGRLYDAVAEHLDEDNVFMDLEMPPGVDFTERITEVVSGCRALLVVIGPRWAEASADGDGPRIAEEDDFVRFEVETGLGCEGVVLIPILVGGARMPHPEQLPEALRPITRRNALEIGNRTWRHDVARLLATLERLRRDRPRRTIPATQMILEGLLVAGVVAYLGRTLGEQRETQQVVEGVLLRRAANTALIAAALTVWLGWRTERKADRIALWGALALIAGGLVGALSGAIWGTVWNYPDAILGSQGMTSEQWRLDHAPGRWDALSAIPIGALLGGVLGGLWRPRRLLAGITAGVVTAVLAQLVFQLMKVRDVAGSEASIVAAAAAAATAGAVLVVLTALDRGPIRLSRRGARTRG